MLFLNFLNNMNDKIIKPSVKIYPCSSCKNFIHWQEKPMYLYHNSNIIFKNYNIQFFCEECYLDSFLTFYGYFNIEFTYIDYILMAILTQDERYLRSCKWQDSHISTLYYENRFINYQSFFIYFLSLYNENSSDFLVYILRYSSNFFELPIRKIWTNIFLDYDIQNSKLYVKDKKFFINRIHKQLYKSYIISGLEKKLNEDVVEYISQY